MTSAASQMTLNQLRETKQYKKARAAFPSIEESKILMLAREDIAAQEKQKREAALQKVTAKFIDNLRNLGVVGRSFTIDALGENGTTIYKVHGSTAPSRRCRRKAIKKS